MTLTLEPRDLLGVEDSAGPVRGGEASGPTLKDGRGGGSKTVEVELRRQPGEGFGFVIASQKMSGGKRQLIPDLNCSSVCDQVSVSHLYE